MIQKIMACCVISVLLSCSDAEKEKSEQIMNGVYNLASRHSLFAQQLGAKKEYVTPDDICYSFSDTLKGERYSYYVESFMVDEYKDNHRSVNSVPGFGMRIASYDDTVFVEAVYPNSSAEQAGITSGDKILAVDSIFLRGQTEVFDVVTGSDGNYELFLLRNSDTVMQSMEKKPFSMPIAYSRRIDSTVGYIYLSSFMSSGDGEHSSSAAFKTALQETADMEVTIIDLRDNTGGYVEEAQQCASFFLDTSDILARRRYFDTGSVMDGVITTEFQTDFTVDKDREFIILANEMTASASELFISGLRYHCEIPVVGTTTYGKARGQKAWEFNGGGLGLVQLTVESYLTPDSTEYDRQGLAPDFSVTENDDFEDAQLHAALDQAQKITGISVQSQGSVLADISRYNRFYGIRENVLEYHTQNYKITPQRMVLP
ncbi:MAG: S41 family peptidase [Fibrobacterota bacterium]